MRGSISQETCLKSEERLPSKVRSWDNERLFIIRCLLTEADIFLWDSPGTGTVQKADIQKLNVHSAWRL